MIEKKFIRRYLRRLAPLPTSLTPQGKLKENIRCVLFDIYGTLFISGSGDISLARKNSPETQQLRQLLRKYAIRKMPQTLLNEFYGAVETVHDKLRNKGVDYPEIDIEQIWMQVLQNDDANTIRQFAVEFELIVNPVYPMPNLAVMLSACRHQNILMGIISNAQFYTPFLFRWFLNSDLHSLGFNQDLLFYSYRFKVAKLWVLEWSWLEWSWSPGSESWGPINIILPLLRPTIVVAALFRLIDSIKAFPLIYVLTNGGPGLVTEVTN